MESVTCKDARIDIALLAGNDLDAAGEQKLKRHMAACPHCREHWQAMRRSVRMLQEPAEHPVRLSDSSLWPVLSKRLPIRERRRYRDRFNGWGPAVAVIAACSLLLMFAGGPDSQGVHHNGRHGAVSGNLVNSPIGLGDGGSTFESGPLDLREREKPDREVHPDVYLFR